MEELTCLLDTSGLRISYDASNQWLYNQWLGRHDEESVRQCAELICASLRAQPCHKMLSDHSQLTGDWRRAVPTSLVTLERLAAQGIAYFAWVYSPVYNDRLAMEEVLPSVTRPTVVIFDDVYAAYAWLQRMPSHPPVVRCREAARLATAHAGK